MKAQRRLGLAPSWPRVTSVFLIDVAVLVVASRVPGARQAVAWWVGIAVAAVVTIAVVLAYRGITVASALARWVPAIGAAPVVQRGRRHSQLGSDLLARPAFNSQLVRSMQLAHDVVRGMSLPTSHVFSLSFQPIVRATGP